MSCCFRGNFLFLFFLPLLSMQFGYSYGSVANACVSSPCENGGVCSVSSDGYTCSCTDGFEGIRCGHVVGSGRMINMDNHRPLPDGSRPIVPGPEEHAADNTNFHIIVNTPATLADAQANCIAMGRDTSGCYLMSYDASDDDVFIPLMFEDLGLYDTYWWLNLRFTAGELYDGRDDSLYKGFSLLNHVNDSDAMVFIQNHPNWEYNNKDGTWINVNSDGLFPYVCECSDVCQPGVGTCWANETCTVESDVTAYCVTPVTVTPVVALLEEGSDDDDDDLVAAVAGGVSGTIGFSGLLTLLLFLLKRKKNKENAVDVVADDALPTQQDDTSNKKTMPPKRQPHASNV